MYIQELTLINFQSHENTTVYFSCDFNVIQGNSRTGKTSVIRSLEFLIFDSWDEVYVRKGEKSTLVSAKFDTGLVLTREKGTGVNKITVLTPEGQTQVYEKFGADIPLEVRKALGIFAAKIDSDYEVNLNLSSQDDSAFLINASPLAKTKFLNRLTGAHIVDSALRTLNKEKLELSSERNKLSEDSVKYQGSLSVFDRLDEMTVFTQSLESKFAYISNCILIHDKLERINASLQDLKKKEAFAGNFIMWYSSVEDKFKDISKKYQTLERLRMAHNQIQTLRQGFNHARETFKRTIQEQQELVKQYKVCPLCGKDLDAGQEIRW